MQASLSASEHQWL